VLVMTALATRNSPAITETNSMTKTKKLPPIAPGEMLRDVLDAAGLSANAAALRMRIPNNRLNAILHGQRAITPDRRCA
jgi:hypothetical protein